MITEDVQINQSIVQQFQKLHEKGRLAHAYLFIGPAYVGKGETAMAITKTIIGTDKDIGEGKHPDVHVIDNGFGESIKIEQIRELIAQVRLRPFMADKKVFIVRNIENLTKEGANALLKTLEEPSPNSLLFLTTSVPEENLLTVRSRCHVIHFVSVSTDHIEKQLIKHFDETQDSAHFLALLAEGCLGTALQLREKEMFETKNEIIDSFILRGASDDYVKEILADKDHTKDFLNILLSWVRDCMLVKSGVRDTRLIHLDRLNDLDQFETRFSFSELNELNEEIVNMCKMLSENLNIKIPVLIIKERLNG